MFSLLFSGAGKIFADGMVIYGNNEHQNGWDYSNETDQQAFINYKNGLEKMIVGIKTADTNQNGSVWIFPVPASPEKVVIDVIDELPRINGDEIFDKAKNNLSEAGSFLFASQIYPSIFTLTMGVQSDYYTEDDMATGVSLGMERAEGAASDVMVYEHLDKAGMTSELIAAKTADGLYRYFRDKGLDVEQGAIPVLDNYIGKDYSFVASWITGADRAGTESGNVESNMPVENVSGQSTQNIKENLQGYLGIPEVGKMLLKLKDKYPSLDVSIDPDSEEEVVVNGDQVLPYLRSNEGRGALNELIAQIQSEPDFANMTINSGEPGSINEAIGNYRDIVAAELPSKKDDFAVQDNTKGILVIFPSKEIYFPLVLTSVYDSKIVPATIRVVGYVQPKIYQSIKGFIEVSYYSDAFYFGEDLGDFFGKDFNKYTKIEIKAPSKYLTQDLWIKNSAPLKAVYASFIASNPLLVTGILWLLCSLLAAFCAGWIFLKGLRSRPLKLALLGAANCLTIIGLAVVLFLMSTGEPANKEETVLLNQARAKGYIKKRRFALLLFILAPFFFLFSQELWFVSDSSSSFLVAMILVFVGWEIRRVKESDEEMIQKLRAANYSTWTFRRSGGNEGFFLIFFSILFLIISWAVTGLIKFTI